MARPRSSPPDDRDGLPSTDHMDRLVAAFERSADELKTIRQLLDRILDDFSWALNNDKLKPEWCPNLYALADRASEPASEHCDAPPAHPSASAAPVPSRATKQAELF